MNKNYEFKLTSSHFLPKNSVQFSILYKFRINLKSFGCFRKSFGGCKHFPDKFLKESDLTEGDLADPLQPSITVEWCGEEGDNLDAVNPVHQQLVQAVPHRLSGTWRVENIKTNIS